MREYLSKVDLAGDARVGIQSRQFQDFADQQFQAVALLGQARPDHLSLDRRRTLGQPQCDAQARQRRAQLVGNVTQQLPLAADEALQPGAHAVEITGQHAQLIAPSGQASQGMLLIGRLPQVVHGAAQAIQRPGDGQCQQQAEASQHHQRDGDGAEGPEHAAAMPGMQLRVGDAIHEQIGGVRRGTAVVLGQTAPGKAPWLVLLARFEGGGTGRKGTANDRLAVFGENLYVDAVVAAMLLQQLLGRARALSFVDLGPAFGEILDARVPVENPGVLIQRLAQEHGQARDQRDGQPECREDAPEQ